jgi:hypothetical protein
MPNRPAVSRSIVSTAVVALDCSLRALKEPRTRAQASPCQLEILSAGARNAARRKTTTCDEDHSAARLPHLG